MMHLSCASGDLPRGKFYHVWYNFFISKKILLTFPSLNRLTEDKTIGGLGFEKVKLIPDGAALFTRGMGMSATWEQERGFGERSWRYAAVINDMKVEKLFIEGGEVFQDYGPDPFEVSDAQTVLEYLKSESK